MPKGTVIPSAQRESEDPVFAFASEIVPDFSPGTNSPREELGFSPWDCLRVPLSRTLF